MHRAHPVYVFAINWITSNFEPFKLPVSLQWHVIKSPLAIVSSSGSVEWEVRT